MAPLLEFTVRSGTLRRICACFWPSLFPYVIFQTNTSTGLAKGVSAQCLFDLLVSLEGETQDALDALELVKAEKPLRSLGKMATC